MRWRLVGLNQLSRGFPYRPSCRPYGTARPIPSHSAKIDRLDLPFFQETAFKAERPLLLRGERKAGQHLFPTAARWFEIEDESSGNTERKKTLAKYAWQFSQVHFPYELICRGPSSSGSWAEAIPLLRFFTWLSDSERPLSVDLAKSLSRSWQQLRPDAEDVQLLRFDAPLALLFEALGFNRGNNQPLTQLYIAQASLPSLPTKLQRDFPIPNVVKHAGRGDVYDSSLWLGLEPTFTPWHRDPNPNLFYQLCSSKVVRLLPPNKGEAIYRSVQASLGQSASSRIRGEEMMHGPERRALHEAVWGSKAPDEIMEARLDEGDAIFIPKGWWHSVKSGYTDGRLNGSVNWWFR